MAVSKDKQAAEQVEQTEQANAADQQTEQANTADQQTGPATDAGTSTKVVVMGDNPFSGLDFDSLGISEEDLAGLTGIETAGGADIRIPFATLLMKDKGQHKKGDFIMPDGTVLKGLEGDSLKNVSILQVKSVRSMFPVPFRADNTFICRSIDGIVGHADGQYAGRKCAECEFAVYPEAGGASPCRDQRLLLLAAEDGSLFHYQLGGVQVKPFRDFMSAQLMHLLPKARNVLGGFRLDMEFKIVDTPNGAFPSAFFRVADKMNPFVDRARLEQNLLSLKSYKEFERMHLESAANATRVEMAMGVDEAGEAGQNAELF